uniref:Uncharacterized protein n=1 Tax=Chromera velia CCMP2878 TaxID=1169474 RepID=A0A0G4FGG9_9ALVE|eukprot:Cvel_16882.t1-p1 / transcript=Cvel_16882.t1 / gene=Cvel_16882 / organism=Chromera_velia_CCMP2878 / gene_product=hypothetical protein / transcript_product=hypothetical protein / location=Cvel_scaffold1321:19713-24340(+) / protein_length=1096 / sequence_SO=supercontig / SO=protein_coding / is_pseudo=false
MSKDRSLSLSFLLAADGDTDYQNFRPSLDTTQWWGRRDSLARAAASTLWSGVGKERASVGSCAFLFQDGAIMCTENQHVRKAYAPVASEAALVRAWREAARGGGPSGVVCLRDAWKNDPRMLSMAGGGGVGGLKEEKTEEEADSLMRNSGKEGGEGSGVSGGFVLTESELSGLDKRAVLVHLQQSCELEFLKKHRLNASAEVVLKKTNKMKLMEIFREWTKTSQDPGKPTSKRKEEKKDKMGDESHTHEPCEVPSSSSSPSESRSLVLTLLHFLSSFPRSSTVVLIFHERFKLPLPLFGPLGESLSVHTSERDNERGDPPQVNAQKDTEMQKDREKKTEGGEKERKVVGGKRKRETDDEDQKRPTKEIPSNSVSRDGQSTARMPAVCAQLEKLTHVLCFMGVVRDATKEEEKALEEACRRLRLPILGVNLGSTVEFTSKIAATLAVANETGHLRAAVRRLLGVMMAGCAGGEKTGGTQIDFSLKLQEREYGDSDEKKTGKMGGEKKKSKSKFGEIENQKKDPESKADSDRGDADREKEDRRPHAEPILHFLIELDILSTEVTPDISTKINPHTNLRDVLVPVVHSIVAALWRSKLASRSLEEEDGEANANGRACSSTPTSTSVLTLLFADALTLTLTPEEVVPRMAKQHWAAPTEFQLLSVLCELIAEKGKESGRQKEREEGGGGGGDETQSHKREKSKSKNPENIDEERGRQMEMEGAATSDHLEKQMSVSVAGVKARRLAALEAIRGSHGEAECGFASGRHFGFLVSDGLLREERTACAVGGREGGSENGFGGKGGGNGHRDGTQREADESEEGDGTRMEESGVGAVERKRERRGDKGLLGDSTDGTLFSFFSRALEEQCGCCAVSQVSVESKGVHREGGGEGQCGLHFEETEKKKRKKEKEKKKVSSSPPSSTFFLVCFHCPFLSQVSACAASFGDTVSSVDVQQDRGGAELKKRRKAEEQEETEGEIRRPLKSCLPSLRRKLSAKGVIFLTLPHSKEHTERERKKVRTDGEEAQEEKDRDSNKIKRISDKERKMQGMQNTYLGAGAREGASLPGSLNFLPSQAIAAFQQLQYHRILQLVLRSILSLHHSERR